MNSKLALVPLTALLIATATQQRQSFAQTNGRSGPSAQSTSLEDLVFKYNQKNPNVQISPEDSSLLQRVTIRYDRQNPKVVYYSLPLSISSGPDGDFSESPNPLALDSFQRVDFFIRKISNEIAGYPSGTPASNLTSPYKSALLTQGNANSVPTDNAANSDKEHSSSVKGIFLAANADAKGRIIDLIKLTAAQIGYLSIPAEVDLDTALSHWGTMVKSTPVVNINLPIGFGLDRDTAKAFKTVKEGLSPEYVFIQLGAEPIWDLANQPVVSDRNPSDIIGNNVFVPTLKGDASIIQGLGDGTLRRISSSGGVMTYSLTYPGALRYGYGTLDNGDDDLIKEGRLNLKEDLPGSLSQIKSINVAFEGTIKCTFKADISYAETFALSKRNGSVIPLQHNGIRTNSADTGPEINECNAFDKNGLAANQEDPEISRIVAGAKTMHIKQNLNTYSASISVKNRIRQIAQSTADGWKYLPMPLENKLVTDWSSARQCELKRGNQYCAATTEKKFLGIKYEQYCSKWEYNWDTVCNDYQIAIDRFVQVPVEVAYFENAAQFEKTFNEVTEYSISESTPAKFTVTTRPLLCITRKAIKDQNGNRIFSRKRCDASGVREREIGRNIDEAATNKDLSNGAGELLNGF